MEEQISETDLVVLRFLQSHRTFLLHYFRHRFMFMVAGRKVPFSTVQSL